MIISIIASFKTNDKYGKYYNYGKHGKWIISIFAIIAMIVIVFYRDNYAGRSQAGESIERAKQSRIFSSLVLSKTGPGHWTYSPLFSPRERSSLSSIASSYEESKIISNVYSRGYK